jgi:hypothetical protein
MNSKMFKQNTLQKLDTIYRTKESMNKWIALWAKEHCPTQVGDGYPFWISPTVRKFIVVSKVTAKLVPDRKFVWQVEGWDGVNKYTEIIDMED